MSSTKTFEIDVADGAQAAEIMGRARDAARGAGIAISGDDERGSFKGTAEGSYEVDADTRTIRVEVTNKPGFVPWGMVESALRKVFK